MRYLGFPIHCRKLSNISRGTKVNICQQEGDQYLSTRKWLIETTLPNLLPCISNVSRQLIIFYCHFVRAAWLIIFASSGIKPPNNTCFSPHLFVGLCGYAGMTCVSIVHIIHFVRWFLRASPFSLYILEEEK
ncbi:hypothetical protein ACJX0J_019458, partial [Zea mays]